MKNYLLRMSYDGTAFHGWQFQKTGIRSVEGVLLKAWSRHSKGEKVRIIGSGRTDKGVHAIEQAANLVTAMDMPADAVRKALNSKLPNDVMIHSAVEVPLEFHARHDAKQRTYLYKIKKKYSIFERLYSYHHYHPLDSEKMRQGAAFLVGEHDFSAFQASHCSAPTSVRKISRINIEENQDYQLFEISANAFLYRMVRFIMGTLIAIGDGRLNPKDMQAILISGDREKAPKTAPAHGLYLKKIEYLPGF